MDNQTRASWLVYALGALCLAAIVAAFLVVGPSSESATVQSRIVKVQQGVVQSTVSGSGAIQPVTQLNLGFKTAGVVQRIYVSQGAQVSAGKLLAELNPQSTEVTLEQAKASLLAAEASLAQEEENDGETSSGQSGGASAKASIATARPVTSEKATPATKTTTTAPAAPEQTKESAATREANLASAKAAVRSDRLVVQSDEEAVQDTKLYAPTNGTIVTLAGEVGETVSGTGTSKVSSTSSSSSSGSVTGSTGAGTGATAGGRSAGGASAASSSSSSTSSSSSFAVLSDLTTMQLVVPLSESEIVHVHVGQPATVTIEALEGLKLAAEVVNVATLATSNSGVVSYDVTFQLDQTGSGVRPGMSASAEVVVKQEEGVNVPTSAISGGAVTVVRGGKHVRQTVTTGLAGNSTTIVLSGLKAGEEIALPVAASSSSATSLTSRLAGRTGGGLGGGGGLAGGGGGAAFFRGGG
jgi:multidrug efflux pump subunit AcrA (membrane-fusion protein)